ncbi:MAG: arginase [Alphaproteobacteria bacterium]
MINKNIVYINSEIGCGAGVKGCEKAPAVLMENIPTLKQKHIATISIDNSKDKLDAIDNITSGCNELAKLVYENKNDSTFPIVIGGDHSTGFGTWSGASKDEDEYGLIWVDAHFDLHTSQTSDSKNIHGMVVASMIGIGDDRLTNIFYNGQKIKPENIIFIGVRCFEKPEQQMAEKYGIKVYYADEVAKVGFKSCFAQAVKSYQDRGINFGISFDMDCLDTSEMTALGTPVKNGLILNDVIDTFNSVDMTGLNVLEVVEYNPDLDNDGKDIVPVKKVLSCFDS